MADVTARDIMTPDPVTIGSDAKVIDAARIMTETNVGGLPVVDEGRLVGIVAESDLIIQDVKVEFPTFIHLLDGFITYPPTRMRFDNELKRAVAATVAEVMTSDPVTVQSSATIEDVASVLADEKVSRVPVLDGERLVGIVTKHDIVRTIAGGSS